jgi:alpha-beta hydrolase superfamily lysophospholipase
MQQEVEFFSRGARIAATLSLPKCANGERLPAVVLSHGMANDRDEAGQHVYLAERLETAGYAVLRFDFRGCGRSAGPRGRMFIGSEWPLDLRAAVTYIEWRPEIDPARIAAVGSSWGGGVTVFTAAADRRVRSAVSLGAPANGFRWLQTQWTRQHGADGWQSFLARVSADRARVMRGEPSQSARLIGGVIPVDPAQMPFYDEFLASHPAIVRDIPLEAVDDILHFKPEEVVGRVAPTPLLVLHGDADPLVDPLEARAYANLAGLPLELAILPGGVHQLLSGETAAPAAERILHWLSRTL